MRDIGKNIKTLRIKKDMTQDALAEKLFVTRQTVSNYETGKSRPDIDMLMKIAEVLGVDIHAVLYGHGIPADRKRQLISLAVTSGIVLILGLAVLLTQGVVEDYYYNFILSPLLLVRGLALPLFFFLLGWTLVHGISVFLKAKRPSFKGATVLRWVILAVSVGCLIPLLLYVVPALIGDFLNQSFQIRYPPFVARLILNIAVAIQKFPYLPLFLGGGLWLCGLPKGKKPTSGE